MHRAHEGAARTSEAQRVRKTGALAQVGLMSALTAALTVAAFPLPPPLSTITLAPFAIFVAAIFFGPRVGFLSALVGSGAGFVVATSVGTINIGGLPGVIFPLFLVGIMVARGPEGALVGYLRDNRTLRRLFGRTGSARAAHWTEVTAMITGTVYETLTFFVIDYFYTYPFILEPLLGLGREFAFLDFGTLVDLIYIPPALAALRYLRARYRVRYYDQPAAAVQP
jgi:riboflavin transporter FmnP